MTRPEISIILPCYNEGPTFERSVHQIIKVLDSLKKTWEVIFVEDKSTDETRHLVEKLTEQIKNSNLRAFSAKAAAKTKQGFGGQAKAIYHSKNQGRGKSVADGIKTAKGDICGYLDVDCEVSPAYISLFLKELDKGFDMVIGRRFYESGPKSSTRFVASKLYAFVVKLAFNIPIEDTEVGFKFFKRSKILPICAKVKNKHWFWDTEICARASWAGLKIGQVPVLFMRRHDKRSTVRLFADSLDHITSLIKLRTQRPSRYR